MGEILAKILSMIENLLVVPVIWLFPIKWVVVPPGSMAVRFTFGHSSKDLCTGTHVATTSQTFTKMHTALKPTTAEHMFVLTSDGLSLRVRGVALYSITNLARFLACSEDAEQLMIDMCEAATKSAISATTFEDLVRKSEEVEKVVALKLGEVGRSTGTKIKRYRFQDIQIVDPMARAMSSSAGMVRRLLQTCRVISSEGDVSFAEVLRILSPNVTYTSDVDEGLQQESEEASAEVDVVR